MKKVLTAMLVAAGAILFAQETKTEEKTITLAEYKADAQAKSGVENLDFYSKELTGKAEVVKEENNSLLQITPLLTDYCKKTNSCPRAVARTMQVIDAKVGDTVKYEVEVKGEPGAKVGFIINNGGPYNQWVIWQLKPQGKWLKYSTEYKIKATKDSASDAKHKYYVGYDVFEKPVLIKSVKVTVKPAK